MPETVRLPPKSGEVPRPAASAWEKGIRAIRLSCRGVRSAALFAARPRVTQALVCATLLTGAGVGLAAAESQLKARTDFRVEPQCLRIREMPAWLDPNWTETIPDPLVGTPGNLFDPGLPDRVRTAYESSPWIESVCSVRKEYPDRLRVRLRVRTPLAAVPWDGAMLLVDGHGVRLPRAYAEVPDFGFPLRVVDGIFDAPPCAGSAWESRALRAGLSVASALTASGKKTLERIKRIDVSRMRLGAAPGRTEIVLYAAEGGGPIEWGCADPNRRAGLEIDVDRKLDHLERLLAACPDLRKVRYALIQFDETVYAPVEEAVQAGHGRR